MPDIILDEVIPRVLSQSGYRGEPSDEVLAGKDLAIAFNHLCTVILTASDVSIVRKVRRCER